jgi:hypothetical protein
VSLTPDRDGETTGLPIVRCILVALKYRHHRVEVSFAIEN